MLGFCGWMCGGWVMGEDEGEDEGNGGRRGGGRRERWFVRKKEDEGIMPARLRLASIYEERRRRRRRRGIGD